MATASGPRVLVAGLGNIFLGDDAFGVEVSRRLLTAGLPPDVRVMDVGIRSVHLAYQLLEADYDTTILVDVVCRGGDPGTLYVLEPDDTAEIATDADGHSLAPGQVLTLVRRLGGHVRRVLIVGCEPLRLDPEPGLSPVVSAAVTDAIPLIKRLIANALAEVAAPAGS
jgi:hydrogenase maturation protease